MDLWICRQSLFKFKKTVTIHNQSLKATQIDARSLPDSIFREYLGIFHQEIETIKPKVIITFGNQVSSILLDKKIKVSEYRKKFETLNINGKTYKVFPVYYPVGQGMRNISIAKEDIKWILNNLR